MFAADFGSVSGDGRSFRCCTVGELFKDCDLASVRAVQEKCDEKEQGVSKPKFAYFICRHGVADAAIDADVFGQTGPQSSKLPRKHRGKR